MSVEQQVKKTIRQEINVTIGEKEYTVKKPTLHTLLMVCDDIAELMSADGVDLKDNSLLIPHITKMISHDAERQARIIATFILEAKNIKERKVKRFIRKKLGLRNNLTELTEEIMDNAGCMDANNVIAECLSFGDIGFFLQTSISLKGANLAQPTKTEATARGE